MELIKKFKNWLKSNDFIFFDNLENFIMCENFRSFGAELHAKKLINLFTENATERKKLEKFLKV